MIFCFLRIPLASYVFIQLIKREENKITFLIFHLQTFRENLYSAALCIDNNLLHTAIDIRDRNLQL